MGHTQFATAIILAMAIFAVFICPLTFGPPAPQQNNKQPLPVLLALAGALFAALLAPPISLGVLAPDPAAEQAPSFDRLALICTRLC